ncbi:MAG: glycosyl hydrolase 115 family protein [Maribacter sp.]
MDKTSTMIKNALRKQYPVWIFLCNMLMLCSCGNEGNNSFFIVIDSTADTVIEGTAEDLKKDLEKVVKGTVNIVSEEEKLPNRAIVFVLGTARSNTIIAKIKKDDELPFNIKNVKPRGGIWYKGTLDSGQKVIILAGYDAQGMQYAVYDYSRDILGVDPLEYWTGKLPKKIVSNKLFDFENKLITPPQVPILCYFENDVDELANYRGKLLEYDWESYTEMINSLVRLRYNAIEFFDMLGRPEFFLRPEYQKLNPDYQVDLEYLDKMMDYAHLKGMKIQANFQFGYQMYPFPSGKADCWSEHKEDWIAGWNYYLEETPLSKIDIYSLRPRNQVWDWEYKSTCGEDKIEVFNEVFQVFGELVSSHKADAKKVLICYSDGMEMWNDDFRPPKDWIVAWADDGFGGFEFSPNTTDGYDFGTYMHAGYWLNHTVPNPNPNDIETSMKYMFNDYNADSYCMVNGQNFRPFLLNLEAYSAVCKNPDTFNGDEFYTAWSTRYFGEKAAPFAVNAMKKLHEAQFEEVGYVQNLWEIREAISYLSNSPIERPGKDPIPYDYKRVESDYAPLEKRRIFISDALAAAKKGESFVTKETDVFYHDFISLPINIYNDLLTFEGRLHQMSIFKKDFEQNGDISQLEKAQSLVGQARKDLETIYERRLVGDKNEKWKGWYDPKIRRPNNGFPTHEMLNAIADNLTILAKEK